MIMTEEEMDEQLELMESMKTCDIIRNVTLEEVEKLEYELARANSEIRDLKELIIKMLFDRYGYQQIKLLFHGQEVKNDNRKEDVLYSIKAAISVIVLL